jgi:type IX secretion system PorP/SprF family membrane protein
MYAQDTESLSFYYNPVQANPAMAGSEGPGKLRLMYRDYYPGRGLNLYSVYCSYDSFIEAIHGGVGVYVSENLMGDLLNDLRAGAAYSYHLRVSRNLYINAGFMTSVIHRGLDAGNIVLPDQIDPLLGAVLPSGEIINPVSRTVFDAGLGFMISYLDYHAGISVNHLFRPDLSGSGLQESGLDRRLSIHGGAVFYPGDSGFGFTPGLIINVQSGTIMSAIGTGINYKDLSVNILPFFELRGGLSFVQTGMILKKGKIELGYNYNFIPLRNDRLQPFTLSNQVYISVSLYNIEKRDVIKAINYPKM